jgi:hypothetical protein
MAGVADKARFYLERSVPQLREWEEKSIFSKVGMVPEKLFSRETAVSTGLTLRIRMRFAQSSKNETISNTECFPRATRLPNGRPMPSGSSQSSLSAPSAARD